MPNNALMSLNIGTKGFNQAQYRKFIKKVRKLRKEISKIISHEYVIPESQPSRWLDIRLICGDCSIVLRVDPRNLYVRGYSRGKNTKFWEFSDSSLINGAKSLPYSGSLLVNGGLCSAAAFGTRFVPQGYTPGYFLMRIPLGYFHLQRAIVNLAIQKPDLHPRQSARSMLCIIQMITEAARMELIAEHVVENLWKSRTITHQMQLIQTALGMGTFPSLVQSCIPQVTSKASFTGTIVSIEYVRVKDMDISSPCKIYGAVKVLNFSGKCIADTVYDRSLECPESKVPGDYLSLIRSTPFCASDPFVINVDLNLRDNEEEFVKGDVVFNTILSTSYDEHLEEYVVGKHGSVGVGYFVIESGFRATIQVVMINNHDGESWGDVYGSIKASYLLANSESATTYMLFEKSTNEYVQGSSQQSIPLNRPVLPIPVTSDLTITVDLWDHDSLSPIACGHVKFPPICGTQLRNIIGEDSRQVQVSITCE